MCAQGGHDRARNSIVRSFGVLGRSDESNLRAAEMGAVALLEDAGEEEEVEEQEAFDHEPARGIVRPVHQTGGAEVTCKSAKLMSMDFFPADTSVASLVAPTAFGKSSDFSYM